MRTLSTAALLCGVVAMSTSACLQNPASTGGDSAGGLNGAVKGGSAVGDKEVTILGAFGGDEEKLFTESLKKFQERSGITVKYVGDQDFATTIKSKASSGDSPDIGLFPQPGGLLEMAAQGKIQPIDSYLDYDKLNSSLVPGFMDASRYKGRVYGAPMRMAVKSIIWYPKAAYTAGGYDKAPATVQDVYTVADQIKAKGIAPWCIAWNSDQATGWVGTDWLEEYVLRMYGPEVYDRWTSHKIPFNDPRIVKALDELGKIYKAPGMVYGGNKAVLSTKFGLAMTPAFSNPPRCMLHRQGNFATTFYPKNVQADLDNQVGTYPFPAFAGGYKGKPILGGGDLAALFNGTDPDAKKVMEFLSSDAFGAEWARAGGWLSPHKTFDMKNYPDETTRNVATMATTADVFRFDGSDLMPKEVGSGTFWTGMVDWVNGTKSSQQVADAIEQSWPQR
ncbi:ABC transporter substrate-binding protein [Arsenicicoccus dermatophilus]|uniref:ABC transporter substrate-binding protein n=1 Tax=Arsenicicoccus dermatophilus TaxID=1076331 RepID=UPI001F4CCD0C|nr:ABC transporter substrate-binding protein [Arsenicicoccus dermatophilus]MCH8613741.1 ABC transporter substrate-binding protein [Arsenicicoccus dermatophilus]